MQIEIGKYYKTRDGRRAGPIVATPAHNVYAEAYPFMWDSMTFRNDGFYHSEDEIDPNDLVAEWVDDCGDTDAPTFKRGDRVRFKGDDESQRFRGMWFYDMPEVLVVDGRDDSCYFTFEGTIFAAPEDRIEHAPWYPDDSGEWVEYSGVGCPVDDDVVVDVLLRREREAKRFDSDPRRPTIWSWGDPVGDHRSIVAYRVVAAPATPATPAAPAPYFLVHGDGPSDNRHATIEAARAEARRLAALHPGVAFSVMQSVERVVVPVSPVEVTRYA